MNRVWTSVLVTGALIAAGASAGTVLANDAGAPEERALAPARGDPSQSIEVKVTRLLRQMTT